MPFIEKWRRDVIEKHGLGALAAIEPGDRCYVEYKHLVDEWKKEPRWSTVHRLLRNMLLVPPTDDEQGVAMVLAWQVFFHTHVMSYELQKRIDNGDI